MTIVLHVGISKTGSSAIQYGLARHQATLAERGVHYALEDAETLVQGRLIASGNGAVLARQLNPLPDMGYTVTRTGFDQDYVDLDAPISLISSESLSAARPELLMRLRDEVIGDREVRVVAFVRDLYGHAVSAWMQRIKRHGYTGQFPHFCVKSYTNKQCAALRAYAEVFGVERLDVFHYDSLTQTPFKTLLRALDVPADDLEDPPRVNRSLSAAEVEVLIACNRVHKNQGELSSRISDHLIYKHPDRETAVIHSPGAARILAERFGSEVDWLNETFFGGEPRLTIGRSAAVHATSEEDREAVWADAVEALARRLVSAEAQNRKMRAAVDDLRPVQEERAALRAELARMRARGWDGGLALGIARLLKKGAPRALD